MLHFYTSWWLCSRGVCTSYTQTWPKTFFLRKIGLHRLWLERSNLIFQSDLQLVSIYAISAYHHWCCEFESRSGWGVQHYVEMFGIDLRQISGFLHVLRFPPLRGMHIIHSNMTKDIFSQKNWFAQIMVGEVKFNFSINIMIRSFPQFSTIIPYMCTYTCIIYNMQKHSCHKVF
jgi:hypothetical protein